MTGAEDGRTSRLTRTEGELEALPAWSRDGRWVYLASGRSGSLQIWRVPLDSGEPVQITKGGGAEASESPDGSMNLLHEGPGNWTGSLERSDWWRRRGARSGFSPIRLLGGGA